MRVGTPTYVIRRFLTYLPLPVRAAAIMALCALIPDIATAAPWINAGDERARHHLEYLRDRGKIKLPLTTWPLPWTNVKRELDKISVEDLDGGELWSYRYLKHSLGHAKKSRQMSKQISAGGTIRPFTDFSSDSRESLEARTANTLMFSQFALNLEAQAAYNAIDDDKYRLDGTYAALALGNWIVGVGAFDRWWGPGWHSSLILSNNARPAPGLFVQRKEASAISWPILSYLGEWNSSFFINQLEKERQISQAKMVGGRISVNPLSFLELAYGRTAFWGGEDQLETFQGLLRLATQRDPITREANQQFDTNVKTQSNQHSSLDARLSYSFGKFNGAIYGQISTNESMRDKNVEAAKIIGVETALQIGQTHNRLTLEVSDTRHSRAIVTPLYEHKRYTTGYRFKKRNIGESAGTNALKYSLSGIHYFSNGHRASWRVNIVKINPQLASINFYDSDPLDQTYGEASYSFPISNTTLLSLGAYHIEEDMILVEEEISSSGYVQLNFNF